MPADWRAPALGRRIPTATADAARYRAHHRCGAREQRCGTADSLRQLLQAEPDELRGFGLLTGAARGRGNRRGRLRLTITEIDQRRDRVDDRARRALIVDRAG